MKNTLFYIESYKMLFIIKCYKYLTLHNKAKPIKIIKASEYGNTGVIKLDDNTICYIGNKKGSLIYKNISISICKDKDRKNIISAIKEDYEYYKKYELLNVYISTTGTYPSPTICKGLYEIIKNTIDSYEAGELDDNEELLFGFSSLPDWQWDYFRLTEKGKKILTIYNKWINKEQLTSNEKKMCINAKKNKYSKYFKNLFSEYV